MWCEDCLQPAPSLPPLHTQHCNIYQCIFMFIWDIFHKWFFHHNSSSKQVLISCSNFNKAMTTKFCTWHNDVMVCAKKLSSDEMDINYGKMKFPSNSNCVWKMLLEWNPCLKCKADSRFVPNQWEMSLHCNTVFNWLGANLESALILCF